MVTSYRFYILFLILSFFSGGVLFSYEIIVSKMFTPFVGASVYVWTSILTMTLLGLCLGYLVGTHKSVSNFTALGITFLIGSALITLSNYLSPIVLSCTTGFEIRMASILSGLLFVFPVMFILGMVSPIMISLMQKWTGLARVGIVYGVSTLGGVIMALLFVHCIVPIAGIRATFHFLSLILVSESIFSFVLSKKTR